MHNMHIAYDLHKFRAFGLRMVVAKGETSLMAFSKRYKVWILLHKVVFTVCATYSLSTN